MKQYKKSNNTLKRLNDLEQTESPSDERRRISKTIDILDRYFKAETDEEGERILDEAD